MTFNNADNPELLQDLWPVLGKSSALVASRDPQVGTYLYSTQSIDFATFSKRRSVSTTAKAFFNR
jgi:hypothetical protein